MKFKVVSFELVSGVENYESGKDFVRIKFEQEYTDIEVINAPRSRLNCVYQPKTKEYLIL